MTFCPLLCVCVQVDEKVSQYACYVFEPLDTNLWAVVHEEDDMKVRSLHPAPTLFTSVCVSVKVYRRELEVDNVVVDPLRASYMVPGITAREMIKHFFAKETRLLWDGMVESVDVVETLAEDTLIFHQLHKRVWPSTQRETLYCSHMCTLTNAPSPDNIIGHTLMVCNFSMDHDKVPVSSHPHRDGTLHLLHHSTPSSITPSPPPSLHPLLHHSTP